MTMKQSTTALSFIDAPAGTGLVRSGRVARDLGDGVARALQHGRVVAHEHERALVGREVGREPGPRRAVQVVRRLIQE